MKASVVLLIRRKALLILAILIIVAAFIVVGKVFNNKNEVKEYSARQAEVTNFPPQTNSEGSVTVEVTPKNVFSPSGNWEFQILLTTHSGSLDQDLTINSILKDDLGNIQKPTGWKGDPPGGHHRQGVLSFQPFSKESNGITLTLKNIKETEEKSFKWQK